MSTIFFTLSFQFEKYPSTFELIFSFSHTDFYYTDCVRISYYSLLLLFFLFVNTTIANQLTNCLTRYNSSVKIIETLFSVLQSDSGLVVENKKYIYYNHTVNYYKVLHLYENRCQYAFNAEIKFKYLYFESCSTTEFRYSV